ncbi:MAG: redoxin domain-containing protein [Pseudomonadales bacterium]|jgi:peroxiredoxin
MTQLVELQRALTRFADASIKLYAISYDDVEALTAFAAEQKITFPLLSDVHSRVIKEYGILNDRVQPGDAMLYGIPFPGSYVMDENGIVVAKFFHQSYKMRTSPEILIDAALGQVTLYGDEPSVEVEQEEIAITASLHGGPLKQGALRHIIVRFELPDGLHIYDDPVPKGMVALDIEVSGPKGLIIEPMLKPPTSRLRLEALDLDLNVWSKTVDLQVPIWATSELASECRSLQEHSTRINIKLKYQACDDETCLLPQTSELTLEMPIEEMHVQNLGFHVGHSQHEAMLDGSPHLRRLLKRKILSSPLGFVRYIFKSIKLNRAAKQRGS